LVDNNVFGVAPVSGVDSEYLFYLVCTLAFGEDSRATTVPSLRKDDVGLRPVPLAPAAEQRSIARALGEKFSTQYHLRSVADASRRRCVRLRQSILKWAFEGRLVDQDPNDEPASALLERIKAEREKAQATAKARKKPARKTRKKRSA
jgi:type I restriction enzyme S subunit